MLAHCIGEGYPVGAAGEESERRAHQRSKHLGKRELVHIFFLGGLDALVNLVAYLGNPRAIRNGSRGQTAFFINEVIVVLLEDVFCRHIRATELGKFVAGLRLEHLEYQGREVLVSEEGVGYTSVCLDRLHTLGEYPVAEFLIDERVYVSDDALAGLLSIEVKGEGTIDKAIAPLIHQLLGGQVTFLLNGLLIMALGNIMACEKADKLRP